MKKYQKNLAKFKMIVYNKNITFWAFAQNGRIYM